MTLSKWDRHFLRRARFIAEECSKDPSTKVGAVIVRPNRTQMSDGYNGFPRGVEDRPALYEDRASKYARIVHAELNAILTCERRPEGCTLYSTLFPCNECAKAIIQAGIARVVTDEPILNSGRWSWQHGIALEMFQEAGVEVAFP